MNSLPPHADRFALHPQARVYADKTAVSPAPAGADPWIAPAPLPARLARLMGAVARGRPFCVCNTPVSGLTDLPPGSFATLTGGSAGQPKVVVRTQASWTASAAVNAAQFAFGPDDRFAVLGDPVHSLALYGLVEAMVLGAEAHALGDLPPTQQADHLATAAISVLYATPTQLRLLAARGGAAALPDLRLILCGGGTLDPATRQAAQTLCPNAAIHVFYGAAETSFIALSGPGTPARSVGRPYPGVDIRITEGTIAVRSPYLFSHYLQGASPHTRWQDGWLSLGEYGEQDAEGHLFLRGRAGRMITVADRNLFLDEVTDHLAPLAHPRHLAVIARPDPLRGQRPHVLLSGAPDPGLNARLDAACRHAFGVTLGGVEARDPFPLLPSGKPDLKALEADI